MLASIAASILFFLLRTFVLRAENCHKRALYVMPLAVTLCAFGGFACMRSCVRACARLLPPTLAACCP